MDRLLLVGMCFFLLWGCGEGKSDLSNSRDSLSLVYKELGFYSFCEAIQEDEFLYMASAAIADHKFPDNDSLRMAHELSIYNDFSDQWANEHNLDKTVFYADKNKETLELGNICAKVNRIVLNSRRPILREYVQAGNPTAYEDFAFVNNNGYFPHSRNDTPRDSYVSNNDITKWMSKYDGSIFEFEYEVKKMLDDPKSFEHVETSANSNAKVKMTFRAKNKFGAKVLNTAYADLNTSDGTVSNIRIE